MAQELEPLLGVREAATVLGIATGTLRRWTYERRVECVRLGRRVLYRPSALKRLIQANERKALQPFDGGEGRR